MDNKFARLVVILVVTAVGYSILGSGGSSFRIDLSQLKAMLLYILLGAAAYAVYVTIRPRRRPPGV